MDGRTMRARARRWIRLFSDGRSLCNRGYSEDGVWWNDPPVKRADGSIYHQTRLTGWEQVDRDIRQQTDHEQTILKEAFHATP